ncbi:hypothetical protein [Bacillus horti]|uniref:hypothetical protein n=1 Tax=Caldalkalibacillus horti TaxID=77523 RepID=UPI0031D9947C
MGRNIAEEMEFEISTLSAKSFDLFLKSEEYISSEPPQIHLFIDLHTDPIILPKKHFFKSFASDN